MSTIRFYKTSDTDIRRIKITFDGDRPVSVEINPGEKYWGPYDLVVAPGSGDTMISAQHDGGGDRVGEVFSAFLKGKELTGAFVNFVGGSSTRSLRQINGELEESKS